jgi:Flp pilus assembly protein TadG
MQQQRHGEQPMNLLHRSAHGAKHGQALVEFALVLPIFILLLVAIFDLGRAVFAYNTLTNAAREGARIAIVNQYKPSIIARAKQQTAIVELNDPSVQVDFYQVNADGTPDTSSQCALIAVGCLAVVSFEATYQPITPLIGNIVFKNGVTFSASSVLSVEFSCPLNPLDGVAAANCPKQP